MFWAKKMKIFLLIILIIGIVRAETNGTSNSIFFDPFILADNGMSVITLFLVGHLYKRKFGISSSCEDSKHNKVRFTVQSSGSELGHEV